MNPFEGNNIQCKRNDAIDSGVGFGVSFGVFTVMFIIAVIVDFVSM
ncbi:YqzM family protein [Lysinibacillus sp. NPDC097195]